MQSNACVATHPTFTEWLMGHIQEDTPTGDLARDVAEDPTWPRQGNTIREFGKHLYVYGAEREVLIVFRKAWNEYARSLRTTPTQAQQDPCPIENKPG